MISRRSFIQGVGAALALAGAKSDLVGPVIPIAQVSEVPLFDLDSIREARFDLVRRAMEINIKTFQISEDSKFFAALS